MRAWCPAPGAGDCYGPVLLRDKRRNGSFGAENLRQGWRPWNRSPEPGRGPLSPRVRGSSQWPGRANIKGVPTRRRQRISRGSRCRVAHLQSEVRLLRNIKGCSETKTSAYQRGQPVQSSHLQSEVGLLWTPFKVAGHLLRAAMPSSFGRRHRSGGSCSLCGVWLRRPSRRESRMEVEWSVLLGTDRPVGAVMVLRLPRPADGAIASHALTVKDMPQRSFATFRQKCSRLSVPPNRVVKIVESASRTSPPRLPSGGIQRKELNSRFPAAVNGCGRDS